MSRYSYNEEIFQQLGRKIRNIVAVTKSRTNSGYKMEARSKFKPQIEKNDALVLCWCNYRYGTAVGTNVIGTIVVAAAITQ